MYNCILYFYALAPAAFSPWISPGAFCSLHFRACVNFFFLFWRRRKRTFNAPTSSPPSTLKKGVWSRGAAHFLWRRQNENINHALPGE